MCKILSGSMKRFEKVKLYCLYLIKNAKKY